MVAIDTTRRSCIFFIAVVILSCCGIDARMTVSFHQIDPYAQYDVKHVAQMFKNQQMMKIWLLDVNAEVLEALVDTEVLVIVGLPSELVKSMGGSECTALSWVNEHISLYTSTTGIKAIAVGNEFITRNPHSFMYLVPACWNMYNALRHFELDLHNKVAAPWSISVLEYEFPSSVASFNKVNLHPTLLPFLNFLRKSRSFFMANMHPVDCSAGAIVDMLHIAMVSLGYEVPIVVAESQEEEELHVPNSFNFALKHSRSLRTGTVTNVGLPLKPVSDMAGTLNTSKGQADRWVSSHVLLELTNASRSYGGTEVTHSHRAAVHSSYDKSWCIAKTYATPDALQAALDWACGYGGADCQPIQLGGPCFLPNTVYSHASYAFNSYYQIHQHAEGTCDFGGTATVTYEDPSYPGCAYPFRAGQVGALVGGGSMVENSLLLTLIPLVMYSLLLYLP